MEDFLEAAAAYELGMVGASELLHLVEVLLGEGIESPTIVELASSDYQELRREDLVQAIGRIMTEMGKEFIGRQGVGLLAARREAKRIVFSTIEPYEGVARLAAIANDVPETFSQLSTFLNLVSDWGLPEYRNDVECDIIAAANSLLRGYRVCDLVRDPQVRN